MKKTIIFSFTIFTLSFFLKSNKSIEYYQNDSINLTKTDSLILWKPNLKLSWADFQGDLDSLSEYEAMTFVIMHFNLQSTSKELIIMNIPCYFIKSLSWSKDKKSLSLLNHEKTHFDIGELITRKIRKEFSLHQSKTIDETNIFMDEIVNKKYKIERDSLNKEYDEYTKHGLIEKKQKEWDIKITKELKLLERYSKTKVIIKRG